jgi:type I restriction enzyme, S subunit
MERLGDMTEVITKGTTPTTVGYRYVAEGINFVKVESISPGGEFLLRMMAHIDDDCHKALRRSQLQAGDILFSIAGALGRTAIVTEGILPANTNQALAIIRLRQSEDILPAYIFKSLSSGLVIKQIEMQRGGVAQQNLSLSQLADFQIPIPPISEQRRIVTILDEAFEGVATAMANAKKCLANAQEMVDGTTLSIFANEGRSWPRRKLGELSEVQSGGTPLRTNRHYWGGGIAWYSSGELNELHTTTPERTITSEGLENSNAKLFPRDSLLIGMYDTAALKMSLLDRDAAFNQAVAGVKPHPNTNLIFVMRAINASKSELLELRRGVRQKNLSLGKIKDISLPMPPLEVQNAVVNRIAVVTSFSEDLTFRYRQKARALSELRQSILGKAFSGELTSLPSNALDAAE